MRPIRSFRPRRIPDPSGRGLTGGTTAHRVEVAGDHEDFGVAGKVRAMKIIYASALFMPMPALAVQSPNSPDVTDLSALSIEELAELTVLSATKTPQALSEVPTSLYVITREEILRSGAQNLPETLRLAPNLQVQQINTREYAITARGFNGYESANKLLVVRDGRSLYSTLFSGVFWELHQPLLEDIQQIEVISGPGGTLHGPNAVNGVINITSRSAFDTQSGLVRAEIGTGDRRAAARYGFGLGPNGAMRIYGQMFERDGLPAGAAPDFADGDSGWAAGFRTDFTSGAGELSIQGELFDTANRLRGSEGERGGHAILAWSRRLNARSSAQLQVYYDHFEREFLQVRDALETIDLDAQLNLLRGDHQIVTGFGMRTTRDEFINNLNLFRLEPESRRLWIFNGFVQDRITLSPELTLIAGIKVERSSYSGFELLPNIRLGWNFRPDHMLWGAVSRAVRTPSRIDRDLGGLPFLAPAPDFRSEKLVAFELGYRGRPTPDTSLSINLFFNRYDDLRTASLVGDPLPGQLTNNLAGHSYGLEAWAGWQPVEGWRLRAGLNLLGKDFHLKQGTTDTTGAASLGLDPDYQFLLRSSVDVADNVHFDAGLRGVGGLEGGLGLAPVGSYVEADARLGWFVSDGLELYVAARNLLHRDHQESSDPQRAQLAERAFHLGSRIRF